MKVEPEEILFENHGGDRDMFQILLILFCSFEAPKTAKVEKSKVLCMQVKSNNKKERRISNSKQIRFFTVLRFFYFWQNEAEVEQFFLDNFCRWKCSIRRSLFRDQLDFGEQVMPLNIRRLCSNSPM